MIMSGYYFFWRARF